MRRLHRVLLGTGIALTLTAHAAALAGPYGDELAKCLVKSTTAEDKSMLVQWMFSTMALHPDVKWMAAVSSGQRDKVNESTAKIFETLLTKTCLSETKQAIQYEGGSTIESSFNVLGQVAARELFSHPLVAAGNAEFAKHLDTEAMKKLLETSKAP
jgi:hypothetical protein